MMNQIKNTKDKLHTSYLKMCFKVMSGIALMLSPVISFADAPSASPWDPGVDMSTGNMVDTTADLMKKIFSYIGLFVGAILILGAVIFIWNSVNMPKEEKEHHNVPLRIFMGIAAAVIGLALIAILISGMNA